MKKKLPMFILFVGFFLIIYGLYSLKLNNIQITNQNLFVDKGEEKRFFPDWTEAEVIKKINTVREEEKLSKLVLNEKLTTAAKSRMSVVLYENDFDGKQTGVTREKSLELVSYDASVVGDLVLLDFFKSNDPIVEWKSNKITRETLLLPSLREIGIAIKNNDEKVSVYVMLSAPKKKVVAVPTKAPISWSGPELWETINKRRVELGVNPLSRKDGLCTIAAIRLNQLLELGRLDGHSGFTPTLERADLKWISEKYNISEYLVQGYSTPSETVKAWENTLGHRSLVAGGEFVWGCVYAQNSFGVAITAY